MTKLLSAAKAIIDLILGRDKFSNALPEIFDSIDDQIPALLHYTTGYEVEELIARSIQKATGRKPTKRQVKKVIKLYSPVKAAIKAFRAGQ